MINVDFHTHSLFSPCGVHTCLEMIEYAKKRGLSGIGISDHGVLVGGKTPSTFYERFENPVQGIKVFKGIECNISTSKGDIDLPEEYKQDIDIILAGFHSNTKEDLGIVEYTDRLIKAIQRNPALDIIAHPNSLTYPVEYGPLCNAAADLGKAIELNNSKIMNKRVPKESAVSLMESAGNSGCLVAVSSDAHCVNEIGVDEYVSDIITETGFPMDRIINYNAEKAFEYIERRKGYKSG